MSNNNNKPVLSKRELEVLQEVAKGLSNQEIARELTISFNTVRVHLRNIFAKLDVQSRTEATMRAMQAGWITPLSAPVEAETDEKDDEPTTPLPAPSIPRLPVWQRIYLIAAVVVALLVFATPIIKPILGARSRNPIPLPPNNNASSAPPVIGERWERKAEMPTARSRMALIAYHGKLYLIGGNRSSGVTGLVEVFDPAAQTWQEIVSKPTLTADIQAAVIGDEVYIAGGCANDGQPTSQLEILDLIANTWHTGAPLPTPLCAYAATAYNDELYLIGGWDGQAFVDSVYIYNPQEDAWRLMNQPYPLKLGYAAAAVKNEIYVAGGYDGQDEYADVYILNGETGQWRSTAPLNHPRGGLGLAAAGENIYAIGGGWKTPLATNERLNLDEMQWQEMGTPYLDQWRTYGPVVIGTEILVVGGWNEDYPNTVLSYPTVYKVFIPITQ